jgi:DNA-binding response OmpR family regulator
VERVRTILIVDDDEEICDFLVFEFTRRGWRASFALDGDAAWARLGTESFDVVLSDVKMPVADGLTLLGRIRALAAAPVFILMSGYHEIERDDPRAAGVADIVNKPFGVEELFQSIERSLGKRSEGGGAGG